MYKGGVKLLFLMLILVVVGLSATLFGFSENVDEARDYVKNAAEDVVDQSGQKVVETVVESGKEKIGEALVNTGEKILYEKFDSPGYFGSYDPAIMDKYQYIILFFTADWCPSCREAENAIEEKKSYISPHIAIMRVDFEDDMMREQYAVEKQHTFVLLDTEKNEIKRWTNSKNLEDLIYNTK